MAAVVVVVVLIKACADAVVAEMTAAWAGKGCTPNGKHDIGMARLVAAAKVPQASCRAKSDAAIVDDDDDDDDDAWTGCSVGCVLSLLVCEQSFVPQSLVGVVVSEGRGGGGGVTNNDTCCQAET